MGITLRADQHAELRNVHGSLHDERCHAVGRLQTLTGQLRGHGMPAHHQHLLKTADNQLWRLDLPSASSSAPMPMAGQKVEVTVTGTEGNRLFLSETPRQLPVSSQRRQLYQTSKGTAPKGKVAMIVFVMDLTTCGTAGPAATPQVSQW